MGRWGVVFKMVVDSLVLEGAKRPARPRRRRKARNEWSRAGLQPITGRPILSKALLIQMVTPTSSHSGAPKVDGPLADSTPAAELVCATLDRYSLFPSTRPRFKPTGCNCSCCLQACFPVRPALASLSDQKPPGLLRPVEALVIAKRPEHGPGRRPRFRGVSIIRRNEPLRRASAERGKPRWVLTTCFSTLLEHSPASVR
jgi:hypothetical protein